MAEMNDFGVIKESFEYISGALDAIRAQNAMSSGNMDKVLANINVQLEHMSNEENADLMKIFFNELKKGLEERHNFVSSKFSELQALFVELVKNSEKQLQGNEIKELFEIIATNLSTFSKDFTSQKDSISDLSLKIEELYKDDSDKQEILKNISVVKFDLEKIGNGFESIVLKLNDNFKELSEMLIKIDSREEIAGFKKDIENIFLSSNAILSTMQVIDHKNRELEEVINHLVTKEDFKIETDQVAKLISQNAEFTKYINGLPTKEQMETLTEKLDTSIGVVNALKNIINESGKQNQKMLSVQLESLEEKILNISTEEEFIGFRKELSQFAKDVMQSTNLMRADLADTNSGLKGLYEFLNSMDIKNSFVNFSQLTKNSENNIKESISDLSETIAEEIVKNRNLTKTDIDKSVLEINSKLETAKNELIEGSKINLANIVENIQSVINNLFSVKNAMHIDNVENLEAIDEKIQHLKEEIINTSNFVVQNSQTNLEKIVSNVEKVFQEVSKTGENLSEFSVNNEKNFSESYAEISKKIEEIKTDLNQNSQESFAKMLSIVEEFAQEMTKIKNSLENDYSDNAAEIKETIGGLSLKLNLLQEGITKDFGINFSEVKDSIESLLQTTKSATTNLGQSTNSGLAELKNNIEEVSQKIGILEENVDIRSQANLGKIAALFVDLTKEINSQKAFLSEFTQANFESVSLNLQSLSQKIAEINTDFGENIKYNFIQIQDEITKLPETIKQNQIIFEQEQKTLIEENTKGIEEINERIQSLIKGIVSKDNPFKEEVLYEFSQLKSSLQDAKEGLTVGVSENVNSQIQTSIEKIEEVIKEYDERYNLALSALQKNFCEYLESVKQVTLQSDSKITNSLNETYDIKIEIRSLLQELTALRQDPALAEMAKEIGEKFDSILVDISKMEEESSSKNSAEIKKIIDSIENQFNSISEELKGYKASASNISNEIITELDEKTEALKSQLNLVSTDIVNILSSRASEIITRLVAISDAVNKITEIDFEEILLQFNNQVESSYLAITSTIKEYVKSENEEQFQSISQEFIDLKNRLEQIVSKASLDSKKQIEELSFISGNLETALNNIDEIKTSSSLITEKVLGAKEEIIEKINLFEDNLFLSQDETNSVLTEIKGNISSIAEDINYSTKEAFSEVKEELLEKTVISQNETKSALDEIKEKIEKLTEEDFSEIKEELLGKINKFESSVLESRNEVKTEIIEKIEKSQVEAGAIITEKLSQMQEEVKTSVLKTVAQENEKIESIILKELEENIKVVKEVLMTFSLDKDFTEETYRRISELQTVIMNVSKDIEGKINKSEESYLKSTQSLLSDVKAGFYEKVEDGLDDLKSFLEMFEDKLNLSQTLEDFKADVVYRFSEVTDNLQGSIESISVKGELEDLNKEIEASINDLSANLQAEILTSVENSQMVKDFSEKAEEIERRIENLKTVITEDINEKLDKFELGFENQKLEISKMVEELKMTLTEFSETYSEMNLNSMSEVSGSLMSVQEKLKEVENNLTALQGELIKLDSKEAISQAKDEIIKEFEVVNQKLDILSLESNAEIEENVREIKDIINAQSSLINKINQLEKLDKLPQVGDISNIKTELQNFVSETLNSAKFSNLAQLSDLTNAKTEILKVLVSKLSTEKLDKLPQVSDLANVKTEIQGTLVSELSKIKPTEGLPKIEDLTKLKDEIQGAFVSELSKSKPAEDLPKLEDLTNLKTEILNDVSTLSQKLDVFVENPQDEIIKDELASFKDELWERLIEFFSQISFTVEAEEIKDFIEDKAQEIKGFVSEKTEQTGEELKESLDTNLENIKTFFNERTEELKTDVITRIENMEGSVIQAEVKFEIQEIKEVVDKSMGEASGEIRDILNNSLGNNFDDILSSLDMLHDKANNVDSNCIDIQKEITDVKKHLESVRAAVEDGSDYTYTLQDVESDIAKVRMILKELTQAKEKEDEYTFDKLSNDIVSISTRTNKLLLNSDETTMTLNTSLDELRNIIYQFESNMKHVDNKDAMKKLEKKLDSLNSLMTSSIQSDKLFNQAFRYLAEWIDRADDNMSYMRSSMLKTSDLELILDKFSKKFDKQQEKIKSLEAKIEKLAKTKTSAKETDLRTLVQEVLSKVEMPEFKPDAKLVKKVEGIDKQLATLGKNIEKITSYVD